MTTTRRQYRRRAASKLRREQLQSWLARAAPWLNESFCTLSHAMMYAMEDGIPSASVRRVALANVAIGRPFKPSKTATPVLTARQWHRITDAIRRRRADVQQCATVADVVRLLKQTDRINRPVCTINDALLAVGISLRLRSERPNFRA